jgi:serine/threonine-protein kinase Chk1
MARLCRSQPEPRLEQPSVPVESVAAAMLEENVPFSFSQPAHLDDMLLNSQLHATQPSTQTSSQVVLSRILNVINYFIFTSVLKACFVSQNTFQKLVRRMTRFFVCTSYEETVEKVCKLLDRLSYTWKIAAKVVCNHPFFLLYASKEGMPVLCTVLPCILLMFCFWVILKHLRFTMVIVFSSKH